MPHFIIEQGNALLSDQQRREAMDIVGRIAGKAGFIQSDDIKIRIRDYQDFLHLDGRDSFIHLTIRLLAGRTEAQKEDLTLALREALCHHFPNVGSLSMEVCDMEPVSYKKKLN